MIRSSLYGTGLCVLFFCGACLAAPLPLVPGDILLTQGNSVYEYSPIGTLMGSLAVPRPSGTRYQLGGVAVDANGRLHVHDLGGPGTSSFYLDYLSTFDPVTSTWIHTQQPSEGPDNNSDQDIAVLGDYVYFNTHRVQISTRQIVSDAPFFGNGTAEVAVGLDGFLYSTSRDYSSPDGRSWVSKHDPASFATLGTVQLKDNAGVPIDIRGLAATAAGDLFAVSWVPSFVYHYSPDGVLLNSLDMQLTQMTDLHLRPDGLLVTSNFYLEVTPTSLLASTVLPTPGTSRGYTAFVPVPEPSALGHAVSLAASATVVTLLTRMRRPVRRSYPAQGD